MIGRQMAHMIYAFFKIYDEQGRAIGLDDLLNTQPGRRRRCAWRKHVERISWKVFASDTWES